MLWSIVAHRQHAAGLAGRRAGVLRGLLPASILIQAYCSVLRSSAELSSPGCSGRAAGSARAPGRRAAARSCAKAARRSRPRPRAGTAPRRPGRAILARVLVARVQLVRAQALLLVAADEPLQLLGREALVVHVPLGLQIMLMADSWSCTSGIWKLCGRFASLWCARRSGSEDQAKLCKNLEGSKNFIQYWDKEPLNLLLLKLTELY